MLRKMLELGSISPKQFAAANRQPLPRHVRPQGTRGPGGYFTNYIIQQLVDKYRTRGVYGGEHLPGSLLAGRPTKAPELPGNQRLDRRNIGAVLVGSHDACLSVSRQSLWGVPAIVTDRCMHYGKP